MKNHRQFATLAVSALTLCLLTGCVSTPPKVTPPSDTVQPVTPPQSDATQNSTMQTLIGIAGKSDAQAVDALGAGEIAKTADGSPIGREYAALEVLGKEASVSMLYDESGTSIQMINAVFSDASYDEIRQALTDAYAKPTEERDSQESGGKTAVFTVDEATIELMDAYGTVSLQITAQ